MVDRGYIYSKVLCMFHVGCKLLRGQEGRLLICLPITENLRWEDLLAVMRMASKRVHGHQRKTRNSFITLRSMAMEAGELSLSLQVFMKNNL